MKTCALLKSTVQHEILTKSVILTGTKAFCEPRVIGKNGIMGLEIVRKFVKASMHGVVYYF